MRKKIKESQIGGWGYSRGHKTILVCKNKKVEGEWIFEDTLESQCNARECKKCEALIEFGEIDTCLGFLPNVKFACCGHGIIGQDYVLLNNGERISVEEYFIRYPKTQ